ncbi:hypothetical protein O0L34_g9424 [Tuta absoluta]|nr:hypothetical protein O0L34_g9424 [Tuta absoluta]
MSKLKTITTRSEVDCPMFGSPSQLNSRKLPTISDVIKNILYVRYDLQFQNSGKQPSTIDVFAIVNRDIENIWTSASIPMVSSKRIKDQLKKHYDDYLKLIRYPQSKRSDNYLEKVEIFKKMALKQLFDVAACKCSTFTSCICPKDSKVPPIEQQFLLDQRSERKMIIASLDKIETKKSLLRDERKQKCQERFREYLDSQAKATAIQTRKILKTSTITPNSELEPIPSTSTSYNTLKIPKLARICDRYGVSNRSAAAITTAVLEDLGLVSSEEKSLVVDKSKLRRARNKVRNNLQTSIPDLKLEGIYFDGRKDKRLLIETTNGRSYQRVFVKEHISLVGEPDSFYLGHTTPLTGTGKGISDSIINYCQTSKVDLRLIKCIGCDGTATNTGWKSGAIRLTELKLGRPLQWFICQLHANELPLRHLFSRLDGGTSGPRGYSGPIGQALETCESLPIQNYANVAGNKTDLQHDVVKTLSTDQKYLYDICEAVSSGVCSVELANRQPGKMAHSRWLTTANRILRLYVGCQ